MLKYWGYYFKKATFYHFSFFVKEDMYENKLL
jgi:hypothetical protein